MPRPLTKVEQGYIRDCLSSGEGDAKVIAKELTGVGPVTVQAFIDGYLASNQPVLIPIPAQEETATEPDLTPEEIEQEMERKEGETEIERKVRIATDSRLTAGRLLGRRDGVVVMTEGASGMIDARKILQTNPTSPEQTEKQKSRIHKPFDGPNQGGAQDRSTKRRI